MLPLRWALQIIESVLEGALLVSQVSRPHSWLQTRLPFEEDRFLQPIANNYIQISRGRP